MIEIVFDVRKAAFASSPGGRGRPSRVPLLSGDANREIARRATGERNIGGSNVLHQKHWD